MSNLRLGIASAFAPSAISGAGALSVGLGAVAASAVAAGSGLALLATVAIPVFGDLADGYKEVTKAEEAYANADTAKEKAKALQELEKAYAGMSEAQRTTTKEMKAFGEWYSGFAKQFETPILETFVKSMHSARGLLTSFEGTIGGLIQGVGELFDAFNANLQAPDVLDFFEFMDVYASDSLVALGKTFGNVFMGIMNTLAAFSPVLDTINGGLVSSSQSFRDWSAGLEKSEGMKAFLDYGMTNLPKFMNILGGLGSVFVSVVQTLAPLGAAMLTVGSAIVDVFKSVNQAIPGFDKLAVAIGGMAAAWYLLPANALRMWAVALTGIATLAPHIAKAFQENGTQGFSEAITNIVSSINTFFTEQLPTLIPQGLAMVMTIIQGIGEALPHIINGAIQIIGALANGIVQNLPMILEAALTIVLGLTNAILTSLPQIIETATTVMRSFIDGLVGKLPEIINVVIEMVTMFINTLSENLPLILDAGVEMLMQIVDGIVDSLPQLVDGAIQIVDSLLKTLMDNLPGILSMGVKILLKIVDGIVQNLPKIVESAGKLITTLIRRLSDSLPELLSMAGEMIGELIVGWIDMLPDVWIAIGKIATSVIKTISEIDLFDIGVDIIEGLIRGLGSMAGKLLKKAGSMASDVLGKFTGIFKIFSPSRVMRDLVGKNIVIGMIKGIDTMKGDLMRTTEELAGIMSPERLNASLDVNSNIGIAQSSVRDMRVIDSHGGSTYQPQQSITQYVTVEVSEQESASTILRKTRQTMQDMALGRMGGAY
ncbi:phage tail protein [Priestia taiwanensis]|nr:hypothetical protein [Priestia taiwanensis]